MKAYIPKSLKLKYRLLKREWNDKNILFASKTNLKASFPFSVSTTQIIMPGAFFDNKLHNLKTASHEIVLVRIEPGAVFSFWRIVGPPDKKNGYKTGRNIVKGKVSEETGGGLCQLSSIIYITALKANLEVTERHNHSVDIYKEEDRFTPLGADATVVYGYKDLRIRNNLGFPLQFALEFKESQLACRLESPEKIEEKQLEFIRSYKESTIEVETRLDASPHCISVYKIMAL